MKNVPANDAAQAVDDGLDSLTAERDCEALAQCMGALYGRAAAVREVRGGVREEGLSERVRAEFPRAMRALSRLSWMRTRPEQHESARVLVAHYLYAGPERRDHQWLDTLRCALMERPARVIALLSARNKGPDAMAQRIAAQRMVQRADAHYRAAREVASDGLWLTIELAAISKAVCEAESDRKAVLAARKSLSAKTIRETDTFDKISTEHLTIPGQQPIVLPSPQVRPANEDSSRRGGDSGGSDAIRAAISQADTVMRAAIEGDRGELTARDERSDRGDNESSDAPTRARRKAVP